jgi:EmrB/QacA subfamily drug resistance transporter
MNDPPDPSVEPRPGRVLIASVCGASLGFIGASVVNVALPTFQLELGADATDIQWIVSGYNLAIASLLLGAGAFSDRFGHRRTFHFGLVCCTAASIVCGAATSPDVMIAARVAQGFAGALLVPSSLGLVNTAYPAATRGHAVGLWSSFSAVGAGLGPFIGGLMIESASWPYMFWMNVPIALLAWWLLSTSHAARDIPHRDHPFDWTGAAYSVATLGVFTFAAIETSALGITHPLVLAGFVLAAIGGCLFIRTQSRSRAPLMPLTMFHSRNFSAVNLATFLAYCTIGGGFYVMMLTWIQIQGYSPLAAGTITLPFMLFTGGLAHAVGNLVRRIGPRLPLTTGMVLLGCGFLSWTLPTIGTSFWIGYLPGVLATALGIALIVGPVTTVVMGSVDVKQSGTASGVNSAVARSAILLSVAVLGAIHYGVFEQSASQQLANITLDSQLAAHLQRELINMAAIDIPATVAPATRATISGIIDAAFLSAARLVMAIAGMLALAGAFVVYRYVGRDPSPSRRPGAGDQPR